MTAREANADLLDEITALRDRVASLSREVAELQGALTHASHREAATREILGVISSSPTDLQPVMDTIVENAAKLADAEHALIGRADGNIIRWIAFYGPPPISGGQPITRSLPSGLAILDRRTTQVEDIATVEKNEFTEPVVRAYHEQGVRSILATPLLRKDEAIGVLLVRRTVVRSFTDKQIALLQTFADQAVIAIENVRLFTELQAKNRELTRAHGQVTEALERQMATSEILRVISSSPTDVQPVFNAIVESATRLCGARVGHLFRFDGELLHLVAGTSTPAYDDLVQRLYPMRPSQGQVSGRAILSRTVAQIPDVLNDPDYRHDLAVAGDWRSRLGVPLLREGSPIGVIVIMRADPGLFADYHIQLLQTFADQAVIAIENVRLFTELQEKNRALTQAHAQTTEALARKIHER